MEKIVNEYDSFNLGFPKSYTYNDLLMIPQYTEINSRKDCSLVTRFSRNVPLIVPFVSSPMDSVTESRMAIEMARHGGLGVLHRFQSIADQVSMVKKVKRAENFIIKEPYIVDENTTIDKLKEIKKELGIKSFLVTKIPENRELSFYEDEEERSKLEIFKNVFSKTHLESETQFQLNGIITKRDLRASKKGYLVKDVMTKRDKLEVYVKKENELLESLDKMTIYDQMVQHRLEKLPIVDEKNNIVGLATEKDLYRCINNPMSNVDSTGKLLVSAAIGCRDDYMERAERLVEAGCDALIVDVANGHNKMK
jgi:IMP dehydrogenase